MARRIRNGQQAAAESDAAEVPDPDPEPVAAEVARPAAGVTEPAAAVAAGVTGADEETTAEVSGAALVGPARQRPGQPTRSASPSIPSM